MKLHRGLMSISDFAAYCGTTRQTLQYYDRIGLMEPIQVGEQGYRYYHPLQAHEVRMIRSFQGSGATLEEVREILHSSGIGTLQDWITEKQEALEQELLRIKREQVYLSRYREFLAFSQSNPLDVPCLFHLSNALRYHAVSFDDPVDLYSEYYFDILIRYGEYCKKNNSLQEYPYFFYVSPQEMQGQLRFNKILCMPENMQLENENTIVAPAGQYLMMRSHPDRKRKEDSRRYAYETMFRFMEEHGLRSCWGCAEQPMSVPPGLRTGDYHFSVIFVMPVIPAGGAEA